MKKLFFISCFFIHAATYASSTITEFSEQVENYNIYLPAQFSSTVGDATNWYELGPWTFRVTSLDDGSNGNATFTMNINGAKIDDNTWATSSPSVGVQYKWRTNISDLNSDSSTITVPSDIKDSKGYLYLGYRLIRLEKKVASDEIILPAVNTIIRNPTPNTVDGIKTIVNSGRWIGTKNEITTSAYSYCAWNLPSEITLPSLNTDEISSEQVTIYGKASFELDVTCVGGLGTDTPVTITYSSVIEGGRPGANGNKPPESPLGLLYSSGKYAFFQLLDSDGNPPEKKHYLRYYDGENTYTQRYFVQWYILPVEDKSLYAGNYNTKLSFIISYN